MIDCPFCGKPGREVIRAASPHAQYRCDPCDVTWSPVPQPTPERPSSMRWVTSRGYEDVPFIDHGERSVPCP